jgi:hypothetical protein
MDITSITAVLGSIKTATDIAKLIKDSDLSLEKAETRLKLADLIGALADAKLELIGVQQILAEAEAHARDLESQLHTKNNLNWKDPAYWIEDGSRSDGPFCQKCYDMEARLVRLLGDGEGCFECKGCKSNYVTQEHRAHVNAQIRAHNNGSCGGY